MRKPVCTSFLLSQPTLCLRGFPNRTALSKSASFRLDSSVAANRTGSSSPSSWGSESDEWKDSPSPSWLLSVSSSLISPSSLTSGIVGQPCGAGNSSTTNCYPCKLEKLAKLQKAFSVRGWCTVLLVVWKRIEQWTAKVLLFAQSAHS